MEQSPFLMWSKRRPDASNPIYDDSWEGPAFAEDAAGGLGGRIWPPRSYSCSFCRREFRSAQALGGHMNVHRRDRARLKQLPFPNHGILHHTAHPDKTGHESISPQIHQLFHNHSPKSGLGASATPISPSDVLRCPVDGGRIEHGKIPPCLSSFQGEFRCRSSGSFDFVPSRSNSFYDNCCRIGGSKGGSEKNNKSSLDEQGNHGYKSRSDLIESNFLMSLNLATQAGSCPSDDDEEEEDAMTTTTFCKRRRTDKPSVPSFLKGTLQSVVDVEEVIDSAAEEPDLELRLGGRPRAKVLGS